ncbi:DsrE family protein [Myxococcota bacterium]|nr:DsrE family protein [Myxococcota bacterium]
MTKTPKGHLIVLTHGQEDGGSRATLAFALAVSLQAMGEEVVVFLHAQAAIWAFESVLQSIHIPGFDRLDIYTKLFEEAGGQIYVCASCAEETQAALPPQAHQVGGLRSCVTQAGLTKLASLLITHKAVSL